MYSQSHMPTHTCMYPHTYPLAHTCMHTPVELFPRVEAAQSPPQHKPMSPAGEPHFRPAFSYSIMLRPGRDDGVFHKRGSPLFFMAGMEARLRPGVPGAPSSLWRLRVGPRALSRARAAPGSDFLTITHPEVEGKQTVSEFLYSCRSTRSLKNLALTFFNGFTYLFLERGERE